MVAGTNGADRFGRYPPAALRADHLRGAAGLALTLGPFVLADPHPLIALPLLAAAALFAVFAGRTLIRQASRVEVTTDGILQHAPLLGAALRWGEVTGVDLRYYSTRRDRKKGWMQLTITGTSATGRRHRIALESTLTGFEEIAAEVARAAATRHLPLTDTTQQNLAALGISTPNPVTAPEA
ncbi:MAG: hypothetical protein RLY86_3340 [Pseudomonadota bacterium]